MTLQISYTTRAGHPTWSGDIRTLHGTTSRSYIFNALMVLNKTGLRRHISRLHIGDLPFYDNRKWFASCIPAGSDRGRASRVLRE